MFIMFLSFLQFTVLFQIFEIDNFMYAFKICYFFMFKILIKFTGTT